MVASVLSGNLPAQKRYVRQVFPTPESPITMILKIRVRGGGSVELVRELLNSKEDSISAIFTVCVIIRDDDKRVTAITATCIQMLQRELAESL